MQNNVLSKKVLYTLMTMSCVYLGGTFAFPVAEAAAAHDTTTVTNLTKVYEDGSTITVSGIAVRATGVGNKTDITIGGKLKVEGSGYVSAVLAEREGTLIFKGDTLEITNNGDVDGWGAGIAAFSGGSVDLKNAVTVITSKNIGVWSTETGSSMTVDNDLKITQTSQL